MKRPVKEWDFIKLDTEVNLMVRNVREVLFFAFSWERLSPWACMMTYGCGGRRGDCPAGVPSETPEEASRCRRERRAQTVFTNRWPEGTTEAAVKETFPTATRVVLRMDGGRFSGAVKLYFSSADEASEAAAKEVTVNGIGLWMRWGGMFFYMY